MNEGQLACSTISFYIPRSKLGAGALPRGPKEYWNWVTSAGSGQQWWGSYDWTLQTFLYLREAGVQCELTDVMPQIGVIVVFRADLPGDLTPGAHQFLVCLLGDQELYHPYAQLHVLQNPNDTPDRLRGALSSYVHVPLWPQPGLIPRNTARAGRFQNVVYFGHDINLAPELRDRGWAQRLNDLGLYWRIAAREQFHDYSEVDAAVAVRRFGRHPYTFKPASKLHNAWLAGVPAILGCESAYRSARTSDLDYIEVTSVDETVAALTRLRDDQALREAMVETARRRAREVGPEPIIAEWERFLTEVAIPSCQRWRAAGAAARRAFMARRYLAERRRIARARAGDALDLMKARIPDPVARVLKSALRHAGG